jgi:hypothetical protein
MRNATVVLLLSAVLTPASVAALSDSGADRYIYFPKLADRVLSGDLKAFREVLELSESTLPGERLEELAEISSRFVRIAPADFLHGQSGSPTCFGVSFMGPGYVDDMAAKKKERALRRAALEAVSDPSLADVKRVCLSRLGDA